MKSCLLLTFLGLMLLSCDPGADRINEIDKEIRELRVQLKERKANEIKLKQDFDTVAAAFQSVYDSDLPDDQKAKQLQTIEKEMIALEMARQQSQIETTRGETTIMRLQLEKDQLKRER